MSPQVQAIFDAALSLPETERALLAERLLETVSDEVHEFSEEDLRAELERRRAEMADGSDPGILAADLWLEE